MKKRNWTTWIIIGLFIGIILTCVILILKNKYLVSTKVEDATVNSEQQTFEIWTIEGKVQDILDEIVPTYKKQYPNIKFKVKAFKTEIYYEMLLSAARNNSLPDMFFSWGDRRLYDLVDLDVVADLTEDEQLGKSIYAELRDGALDGYTYKERIYGIPIYGWNNVLYCNTEIFKECQLELPTTYEEFLEAIEVFKNKGITPILVGGSEAWAYSMYFMEMALAHENIAIIQGLSHNPRYFGMEGFKEAARQFKNLIQVEPWQQGHEAATNNEVVEAFAKGNGAMFLSGSWSSENIENGVYSSVKGKIKAIRFPRENSSEFSIAGYADGFALSSKAYLNKDIRMMFTQMIRQISDKAVQRKGIGLPVYQGQDLDTKRHELLQQCQDLFQIENAHKAYDQLLDARTTKRYNDALIEFVKGNMEVGEFIQELAVGKPISSDETNQS